MTNPFDQIISVFLNKRNLSLKDSDISHSLVAKGTPLYVEEVRQHVQALSPALFQLSFTKDAGMTITVDPQIEICAQFLAGRCHLSDRPCGKLHLCRDFGHCARPKCTFPHDFNRGENRRVVEQFNCQSVDCQLLVQLIRLRKSFVRSGSSTHISSRPQPPPVPRQEPPKEDEMDRQIDVSYPASSLARQIDMEIIEMLLSRDELLVEKKFSECHNDYFRRQTIQLKRVHDVDQLLLKPILTHEKIDIKFKRTKQLVDQTSLKLQISSGNTNDRIAEGIIQLYVSFLLKGNKSFTIYDLHTPDNQTFVVQYSNEIDYDGIRQQYQTKRQLRNSDVAINQIYECDTVMIKYNDENKNMRYDDIERLIPSAQQSIFTFEFTTSSSVEIEFINVQASRQWLSKIDEIKSKFHVSIIPVINDVEESECTNAQAAESIPFNLNSSTTSKSQGTTIKLRPEWAMVANHRVLGQEYKKYIRENLGGEIEIKDDEVTYTGDFPRLAGLPTKESMLANKTNNYMQTLKHYTYRNLKHCHVRILHQNADSIAFCRRDQNDYSVAAKSDDMSQLKSKLFPKTNPRPRPDPRHPTENLPSPNSSMRSSPTTTDTMDSLPSPAMPTLSQETSNRYGRSSEDTLTSPIQPQAPFSIFPITSMESISMFSVPIFEDRLQQYLNEMFNVKVIIDRYTINEKNKGEKIRIRLKISGHSNDVENALEDLSNLVSLLHTRKFDDKTNGNWTRIEEATQMIQHHLLSAHLICSCQRHSPTDIHIHFFDVSHPQFGVDEQKIEDLIHNEFTLATVVYTKQSSTAKFTKEWANLEDTIRKRDDYRKDICLSDDGNSIYLFGLSKLVKEFRQAFERLKNQYVPQTCQITLTEQQLNYLKFVAKSDLSKLEKQYKDDGCDISLARLQKQGDFVAPPDMHEKIKANLQALVQVNETTFSIKSNPFEALISKEPDRLLSLVKSKCYLEKQVKTDRVLISIPQAQTTDPVDSAPVAAATTATARPFQRGSGTSLTVGSSTINVIAGDLTSQTVDLIVVCSTSDVLRKNILSSAGSRVQAEYDVRSTSGEQAFPTSNGSLPCKRIFFLPWKADRSDPTSLQPSVSKFVSTAIKHAVKDDHQSIAFPSIGCGQFGFDASLIAQHMINEAVEQLQKTTSKITVSFVLVPSQQDVYNEFVKYLQLVSLAVPATTPKVSSTNKRLVPSRIAYDEKTVLITLISSNKDHLTKCKQDITDLSRSISHTSRLTDKHDMIHWPQSTINAFYKDCLKENVIPTLDLEKCTLELVGLRDAVQEAEKHFFELTAETFKQARIDAVARGVIWSFEVAQSSNTWEQYSYKMNGFIEDAFARKLSQFDVTNDKDERCHIDFSKMEEQRGSEIRRIRRREVNSSLPDEWEPSKENCIRVDLQTSSIDYQSVLQKFDTTMKQQYTNIIKIQRIQNIRWYKQYAAHRDEHKRLYGKLDERLLFHGCLDASANQIIQGCFNRSFAGVNGINFGSGVYFHAHAIYSHQYAKPSITGERTMFLARVLIGKTTVGNPTMKVAPSGYDTTTDGQNIFVVYHDAGAYADYLITYR